MEKSRLIIFDIDGTLLPGTSCERMFFRYLLKMKILHLSNLLYFGLRGIALARNGKSYIIKANKGYLRGFEIEYITEIGLKYFNSDISPLISTKGIAQLKQHQKNGEKVALLSGMPEFLLKNFAEFLDVDEYYGSVMEIKQGRLTGKTIDVFPLAKGKVKIAERALERHNFNWPQLTTYADHYLDRYLLEKAGEPIAVNPHEKLMPIAQSNNWRIEYFR